MPPILSEEETDVMNSSNEPDHDLISTEILEDICDGSQSHPNVNKREACYKIRDRISFFFSSGHRNQITCSLLGGFSKPRAEVTRFLDSVL